MIFPESAYGILFRQSILFESRGAGLQPARKKGLNPDLAFYYTNTETETNSHNKPLDMFLAKSRLTA